MTSEVDNARRCLVDAENFADNGELDRSQAYTAAANAWIRLEELKTQKRFVEVFIGKQFK